MEVLKEWCCEQLSGLLASATFQLQVIALGFPSPCRAVVCGEGSAALAHTAVPHAAMPHAAAPPELSRDRQGTEKGPAWAQAWSQGDLSCKQRGELKCKTTHTTIYGNRGTHDTPPFLGRFVSSSLVRLSLCVADLFFDVGPFH